MKRLNPDTTFFTSDTHFSHEWVLDRGIRHFHDVDEMNFRMIQAWNKVVKPGNTVYHLGDFAFAPGWTVNRILSELNGNIHLILGNHDMHQANIRYNKRFAKVAMQDVIQINQYHIYLNHFPFLCFPYNPNILQFYGHVHSTPDGPRTDDHRKLTHLLPTQYEVGTDLHNYQPQNFTTIIHEIKERSKDYNPRENTPL